MKNGVDILTIIFALWALVSGLFESDLHTVVSLIFAFLICAHVALYWKPLIKQIKTLKRKWVFIVLGFVVIFSTSIMD
jgi:putative effector of murein hydrolase